MALKVLLLRKKLNEQNAELTKLRTTQSGYAKREAELEKDIEAAATEEEKAAVEEAVTTPSLLRSTSWRPRRRTLPAPSPATLPLPTTATTRTAPAATSRKEVQEP